MKINADCAGVIGTGLFIAGMIGVCIFLDKKDEKKKAAFKNHKDECLKDRHLYFDDGYLVDSVSKALLNDDELYTVTSNLTEMLDIKRDAVFKATTIEKFDEALKEHDDFFEVVKSKLDITSTLKAIINTESKKLQERKEAARLKSELDARERALRLDQQAKEREINTIIKTAKEINRFFGDTKEA